MLPSEYVSEIVLPTVDEYLKAMGDRRRAYLACIATYHVRDYLACAEAVGKQEISRQMRSVCANSFDVVGRICNGSKHSGNDYGDFRFAPRAEEMIPPTGYGVGGGYGSFRWGGAPGLVVEHGGHRLLVDFCLCTYGELYPSHLGRVDFSTYKSRLPAR